MFNLETAQSRLLSLSLPHSVTSGWFTMLCVDSYLILTTQSQLFVWTGRFGEAQHVFDLDNMELESDTPVVSPYDKALYFATQQATILCFKPSTFEWLEYQHAWKRRPQCLTYPSEWNVTETELIISTDSAAESIPEDRIRTDRVLERIQLNLFRPLEHPSESG